MERSARNERGEVPQDGMIDDAGVGENLGTENVARSVAVLAHGFGSLSRYKLTLLRHF